MKIFQIKKLDITRKLLYIMIIVEVLIIKQHIKLKYNNLKGF